MGWLRLRLTVDAGVDGVLPLLNLVHRHLHVGGVHAVVVVQLVPLHQMLFVLLRRLQRQHLVELEPAAARRGKSSVNQTEGWGLLGMSSTLALSVCYGCWMWPADDLAS